jgi:RecB family exonuclease
VRPGVNEDAREDQRDHRPCEEGDVEKAFDHWAGRFEGWQVETL